MVLQAAPTQVRPLIDRLNEALDELENSAAESVFSLRLDKEAISKAKAKIIALYPRPIVPAAHGERLSAADQALVVRLLGDYAASSLAEGYGAYLTVREIEQLIAAAKTEGQPEIPPVDQLMTHVNEAMRLAPSAGLHVGVTISDAPKK